jgi:menaquinol-cytochrome c reductase iron-sulfur subunit
MDKEPVDRRNFLGIATFAIGGFITVGLGVPAVMYVVGPSLKQETSQQWIRLGSASKVEIGVPTLFKATVSQQTGWIVNEQEISVYIYTEDGRDFVALSNICTHLGCRVRWVAEQSQFFCPCHNGIFDKAGNVVSGPPPRPLDHFQIKVENNQLYILGS